MEVVFTCTINSIIITSKNIQMWSPSNGYLGNIWHQIIWYSLWIFTNKTTWVSAYWVKIT